MQLGVIWNICTYSQVEVDSRFDVCQIHWNIQVEQAVVVGIIACKGTRHKADR